LDVEVDPWKPNGNGEPKLYGLTIGSQLIKVGFKRVRWLPCQDAPEGAEPWICEVNGKPTFLQGVNWTPIRMDYHGVTREQYAQMIGLYKEMGVNLLRVWGGAFLERSDFYELCDEAGIMVWQEFPLSSAGPENNAPTDPSAIDHLASIAEDYIKRCRHHVSLLMWCGGNELQTNLEGKDGTGKPLDLSHPCLSRLDQIVKQEDPDRRFVPTSASGPRFTAKRECFGQGLHHDVHGPWNVEGDWQEYWQNDDALFRSEVGMPGASDASLIKKYCGECEPLPISHTNPYWQHLSSWWVQDALAAGISLEEYCQKSQELQAEVLGWAAEKTKARFPGIGGMIIWMGHDCAPVPVNTSVIDFEGKPKPAYNALKTAFTGD
jgi:beta-mannosidase